eukprot:1062351-Karenia_brevis.AAC.1
MDNIFADTMESEINQLEHEFEQLLHSVGEDYKASLVELYSPDRFGTRGQSFGVGVFLAVDLRAGWDMNDPKMVREFWRKLHEMRPWIVIGWPPCKAFSAMLRINKNRMDP